MEIKDIRIDKWLWCVRQFKTRSLATEACHKGWITIGGDPVKPSRQVKAGDVFSVKHPPIIKTLKVKQLLANRVGAKLVPEYMEDLTPKEEYDKLEQLKYDFFGQRDRGTGRPTKKERRELDQFGGNKE